MTDTLTDPRTMICATVSRLMQKNGELTVKLQHARPAVSTMVRPIRLVDLAVSTPSRTDLDDRDRSFDLAIIFQPFLPFGRRSRGIRVADGGLGGMI